MKRYIKATSQGRRVRYVQASSDLDYEKLTIAEYAELNGVDVDEAAEWLTDKPASAIKYVYIPVSDDPVYTGIEYKNGTYSVVGANNDFDTRDRDKMLEYVCTEDEEFDW